MGNTGADTAATLCGVADKVYISHNHGALVVSALAVSLEIVLLMRMRSCHESSMGSHSTTQ